MAAKGSMTPTATPRRWGVPGGLSPRRLPTPLQRATSAPSHRPRSSQRHTAPRGWSLRYRLQVGLLALLLLSGVVTLWLLRLLSERAAAAPKHDEELGIQDLLDQQPTRDFCLQAPSPMVCAHGGDQSRAPPNSMRAFLAAAAGGADCVEVDVVRTRDGQLVVLHARDLAQLTGTHALQVGDFDWPQLRMLRWPSGDGIALAEQVLRQMSPLVEGITLDVKTHMVNGVAVDVEVMAEEVLRLIHNSGCHNCLVWAKNDLLVQQVKRLSPGQAVGYVVMNGSVADHRQGFDRLLRLQPAEVVAVHHAMVGRQLLQRARSAGLRVHAWTANSPSMMQDVLSAGVDAVVTNYPQLILTAISNWQHRCQLVPQDRSDRDHRAAAATAVLASANPGRTE